MGATDVGKGLGHGPALHRDTGYLNFQRIQWIVGSKDAFGGLKTR